MKKDRMNFLTVFPPFEALHARKDVGCIPHYLSKICGWSASLAYFPSGDGRPPEIEDADFGRHVSLISLGRRKGCVSNNIRLMRFLLSDGKKFDLVNFYHDGAATLFHALLYKAVNPSGKTYFKLDMDHLDLNKVLDADRKFPSRLARKAKYLLSSRAVDLYTVEAASIRDSLAEDYYYKGRLRLLPNGFPCEYPARVDSWPVRKENVILTVGRLGDPQKFNEVLIDALAMMDPDVLEGWKIHLVGPVASGHIERYAEDAARKHPHLENAIRFTGNVPERDRLYEIYERSRIFCLTSRFESFGLVLAEAMYFGNYVISSDLPATRDLTRNGSIGSLFPVGDAAKLRDLLTDALSGKIDLAKRAEESHRWILEEYDWRKIVKVLDRYLGRGETT